MPERLIAFSPGSVMLPGLNCSRRFRLPAFEAVTAESRGNVFYVTIDSPPMNLMGPALR